MRGKTLLVILLMLAAGLSVPNVGAEARMTALVKQ